MSKVAIYRRARADAIRRLVLRVGIVGLLLSLAIFPRSAPWQQAGAAATTAADWLREKAVVVLGGTPRAKGAVGEIDIDKLAPVNGYPSSEIRCLALAMYHEGGGDRTEAQLAVARVALNRAASFKRPKAICQTIYTGLNTTQGCLFEASCRNIGSTPAPGKALSAAAELAVAVVAGTAAPKPAFAKVSHFHDMKVSPPPWTRPLHRIGRLGRLDFYALQPVEQVPAESAPDSTTTASTSPPPPPQSTQRVLSQPRRVFKAPQNGGNRDQGSSGDLANQVFGQ